MSSNESADISLVSAHSAVLQKSVFDTAGKIIVRG